MIYVDANVFMHAVGRGHPLRDEARSFFESSLAEGEALVTSAEVLQELLHAYLPVGRMATLDAAMQLAEGRAAAIWPVEPEDVRFARSLVSRHPELGARDLLHLACCRRRDVTRIRTFDGARGRGRSSSRAGSRTVNAAIVARPDASSDRRPDAAQRIEDQPPQLGRLE